ncbi:mucin-3A [Genypterus blacodes]|uniref:mucin-3A n=1 Tax=Genypterus blacodes TaxID=154954 RepID=UPI003F75F926
MSTVDKLTSTSTHSTTTTLQSSSAASSPVTTSGTQTSTGQKTNSPVTTFGTQTTAGQKIETTLSTEKTTEHTGSIPRGKANVTLEIFGKDYSDDLKNITSPQSQAFITTLIKELEVLCREADPKNFQGVEVIKLLNGSVIALSIAEYEYENNEIQIQFVNTKLQSVLTDILSNKSNLNTIAQAFGPNVSAQLNNVTLQPNEIKNIKDLEPFVNCSQYANYTAQIINGKWQCIGPCKTNPNYCHQHGECFNEIYKGPICKCYESSLEQYYGPQCELFHHGPGFYGAIFGSLAAVALLLFAIAVTVFFAKRRHVGIWKTKNPYSRRLSAFDEDFFDFTDTGLPGGLSADHNLGLPGHV